MPGGGGGTTNRRVNGGSALGTVNGADKNDKHPELGESGLHVTLVQASHYKKYVRNIQNGIASPITWLMDAARNAASPFHCP